MSIYDDDFSESPKPPAEPVQDEPELVNSLPDPVVDDQVIEQEAAADEPPPRRGWGCGSCLMALVVTGLIFTALCAAGGYLVYRNAPGWAHDAIVAAVNESDLPDSQKQDVAGELDRLLSAYNEGTVSTEQMAEAFGELSKSRTMGLLMAYGTMKNFIEPSGLSEDEKAGAKLAFHRVARGVYEQAVEPKQLEDAFDFISQKDFNGNRKLKSHVADDELRALVAECNRVADEAQVPVEPYVVDVAADVERIVDAALGIPPAEQPVDEPFEQPYPDHGVPPASVDPPEAASLPSGPSSPAAG